MVHRFIISDDKVGEGVEQVSELVKQTTMCASGVLTGQQQACVRLACVLCGR